MEAGIPIVDVVTLEDPFAGAAWVLMVTGWAAAALAPLVALWARLKGGALPRAFRKPLVLFQLVHGACLIFAALGATAWILDDYHRDRETVTLALLLAGPNLLGLWTWARLIGAMRPVEVLHVAPRAS